MRMHVCFDIGLLHHRAWINGDETPNIGERPHDSRTGQACFFCSKSPNTTHSSKVAAGAYYWPKTSEFSVKEDREFKNSISINAIWAGIA